MKFNLVCVHNLAESFIFLIQNMNTNMNTLVCNMQYYKVLQLETRTENPCVGGSIPPLGTIPNGFLRFKFYW